MHAPRACIWVLWLTGVCATTPGGYRLGGGGDDDGDDDSLYGNEIVDVGGVLTAVVRWVPAPSPVGALSVRVRWAHTRVVFAHVAAAALLAVVVWAVSKIKS